MEEIGEKFQERVWGVDLIKTHFELLTIRRKYTMTTYQSGDGG